MITWSLWREPQAPGHLCVWLGLAWSCGIHKVSQNWPTKMRNGIVHHKSDRKSCVIPTADRNIGHVIRYLRDEEGDVEGDENSMRMNDSSSPLDSITRWTTQDINNHTILLPYYSFWSWHWSWRNQNRIKLWIVNRSIFRCAVRNAFWRPVPEFISSTYFYLLLNVICFHENCL